MRSMDSRTSATSSPAPPVPGLGRGIAGDRRSADMAAGRGPRKSYAAPQLTHYGRIEAITMTSGRGEGKFGMNSKYGFGQGFGHGVTNL